ncbi:TPA: winged helix-turn-helix domain-containing protein [Serratia marcescens]
MCYIINKNVCFSPKDKTLSLTTAIEDSVSLSNQATRLLSELIKENNKAVTREHLLKTVWEDYGLTPSNNNLYMAVSELRKSFILLGLDKNIIRTIPKSGFAFEAQIDVAISEVPGVRGKDEGGKKKVKAGQIIFATAALITLLPLTFFLTVPKVSTLANITTNETYGIDYHYEKCQFYPIDHASKGHVSEILAVMKEKNMLNCTNYPKNVFYQKSSRNFTFIGICSAAAGGENSDCESIRIINEE